MAAQKKRVSVPKSLAAKIDFAADRRCCVCPNPRPLGDHLHHIDGDPSNNTIDNLVLLCFRHHDEASRIGGLSRKLTPETLLIYRQEWYDQVIRTRRGSRLSLERLRLPKSDEHLTELILRAVQINEVRQIGLRLSSTEWKSHAIDLQRLMFFSLQDDLMVRAEVLVALHNLASRTRAGMPTDIALMVSGAAENTLPHCSLVAPSPRKFSEGEIKLIESASDIGGQLAYDGALKLGSLPIVDSGGRLLWHILRLAEVTRNAGIKKAALDNFALAEDGAQRRGDHEPADALRWLCFLREDAIAYGDRKLPEYPQDVAHKLKKARRSD